MPPLCFLKYVLWGPNLGHVYMASILATDAPAPIQL